MRHFRRPALRAGFPAALAYYCGKILECSPFCAEPYGGKESVLGEITMEDVKVTALLPEQRCTIASVAGHAMYERSNPFHEYFLSGHIDMGECRYEQYDERTCRITAPRFVGMAGVRGPYTIANIDAVIAWARARVVERFGEAGYELHYTVYGRDGCDGAAAQQARP